MESGAKREILLAGSLTALLASVLPQGGNDAMAWSDFGGFPFCERAYPDNTGAALDVPFNKQSGMLNSIDTAYVNGVNQWLASDSPASFTAVSSNWDSYFLQINDANMPRGFTAAKDPATVCDGGLNGLTVALNIVRLAAEWNNDQNYKHGVATHEMGHVFGLHHSSQDPAVMNVNRNRFQQFVPKADGVCGINIKYPQWDLAGNSRL